MKKNCDWIIANDVSNEKYGFDSEYNEVKIFQKNKSNIQNILFNTKEMIAKTLVEKILTNLKQMVKILVKKLIIKLNCQNIKLMAPLDGSYGFLDKPVSIMPQKSELISTGLSIAFPNNTESKLDQDLVWQQKIIFQF